MLTRRGFLGILGTVGAVIGAGARLIAGRFRPESQIRLFDYWTDGQLGERTTNMIPADQALCIMETESGRYLSVMEQYKFYGPYDEPAWLTRDVAEGVKRAKDINR